MKLASVFLLLLPTVSCSALFRNNQRGIEHREAVLQASVSPRGRISQLMSNLRGGAREEHTYAMLKPDVASDDAAVDAIKQQIEQSGLRIVREECGTLSKADCEAFYAEHKERPFFPDLVKFMSSGPVLKMELAGPDAIKQWRKILDQQIDHRTRRGSRFGPRQVWKGQPAERCPRERRTGIRETSGTDVQTENVHMTRMELNPCRFPPHFCAACSCWRRTVCCCGGAALAPQLPTTKQRGAHEGQKSASRGVIVRHPGCRPPRKDGTQGIFF